jgi:hypothetical protein
MKSKYLSLGIVILALSSCAARDRNRDRDDYRAPERGRNACLDQAREQGYRRVEIQSSESVGPTRGPGIWEITMRAMASTGREVKLACTYDAGARRAAVSRVD